MNFTRYRVLTPSFPSVLSRTNLRRNELHPLQGIDTSFVAATSSMYSFVEMNFTRYRVLTQFREGPR